MPGRLSSVGTAQSAAPSHVTKRTNVTQGLSPLAVEMLIAACHVAIPVEQAARLFATPVERPAVPGASQGAQPTL